MTDKIRKEFEAWWSSNMNLEEMDLHRFADGYSCHETNRGWMVWWASRAEMVIVLPEPIHGIEVFGYKAGAVRAAIEAAGAKWRE